jgi:hypothetical protein
VKKIRPGMMAPPASSAAKTASDDRGLAGSVLVSIVPLGEAYMAPFRVKTPIRRRR